MNDALFCRWANPSWDDSEIWETDCGQSFVMFEGSPADNGMRFCCYCGRPLKAEPSPFPSCEDDES